MDLKIWGEHNSKKSHSWLWKKKNEICRIKSVCLGWYFFECKRSLKQTFFKSFKVFWLLNAYGTLFVPFFHTFLQFFFGKPSKILFPHEGKNVGGKNWPSPLLTSGVPRMSACALFWYTYKNHISWLEHDIRIWLWYMTQKFFRW